VAKTLQSAYHRLNTKARKYEPLSPQERLKWEAYYAADQKELSDLLQALQVIE
jgi:predicted restriction endonuclease